MIDGRTETIKQLIKKISQFFDKPLFMDMVGKGSTARSVKFIKQWIHLKEEDGKWKTFLKDLLNA